MKKKTLIPPGTTARLIKAATTPQPTGDPAQVDPEPLGPHLRVSRPYYLLGRDTKYTRVPEAE